MRYDIPSFRIDKHDFLKGSNLYDDYPDGGFLTSSSGMNAFSKPGLLCPAPNLGSTVTAGLPSGGVIGWWGTRDQVANGSIAVMCDGSGNGYYYNVDNSGNFVINGTADTANVYKAGLSDTILFQNVLYTTTDTDIVFNDRNLVSLSRNVHWWTVTMGKGQLASGTPHPMAQLGQVLYIASQDALHSYDGTVATYRAFVLDTGQVTITALGVYNGYLYIAVQNFFDNPGTVHGRCFIRIWDGFSKGWNSDLQVDYRINALVVYKNILYMFSSNNIQYFFRNRFHVLHPLQNQVFRHDITTTSDSMFFADGPNVWRYGSPFAETIAQEKFYKYFTSPLGGNIGGIYSWYQNSMVVMELATNSKNYFVSDVNAPNAASSMTLDFNPKFFPYPVRIRNIFADGSVIASGMKLQVQWTDSYGNVITPGQGVLDPSADSTLIGTRQKRMDINGKSATRLIQPRIVVNGPYYLRYIDFLYEKSEDQLSK